MNRKELLAAIDIVQRSGAITVVFKDNLILSSTMLTSIKIPFNHDITGALEVESLYNALAKMKTDEVSVEQKEGHVYMKAGKIKVKLAVFELAIVIPEGEETAKLPGDFYQSVQNCLLSRNKNPLEGLSVLNDRMYCTNGAQFNVATMETVMPCFWINTPAAKLLLEIGNVFSEVSFFRNWIIFHTIDGKEISFQKLNTAEYPYDKYDAYLETLTKGEFYHLPEQLSDAVSRASLLAAVRDKGMVIVLTFGNHLCIVSSGAGTKSEYTEELEGEFGKLVTIIVDAQYIDFALCHGEEFSITEGDKKMFVARSPNSIHVVAGLW